jgi:uncharacterized protein
MSENKSIDTSTLEAILKHLVTEPDKVKINRVVDEQGVLLSVVVDSSDMGIVIGRGGIMANSIKTIMRALGKANKMNVRVEFLEPDGSRKEQSKNFINNDEDNNMIELN